MAAAAAAASLLLAAPSALAADDDKCTEDGVCLQAPKAAKWSPGESATEAERKKRRRKDGGKLSVTIEDGRGSLFVNGRYAGTAPVDNVRLPRGKNDIRIQDGETVVATGVLIVPSNATIDMKIKAP
jgi:hypothetical protein